MISRYGFDFLLSISTTSLSSLLDDVLDVLLVGLSVPYTLTHYDSISLIADSHEKEFNFLCSSGNEFTDVESPMDFTPCCLML